MTDKPQRPVQSSSDALAESADEASAALADVNEDLRTSMERIAQLAGTASSSIGMRNLATELQEIGTTMARTLGNTEERVTEMFASEADALDSLLRDGAPDSSDREREPHAALDRMNMDLAAWRERAGIGPTDDSPLEYPLPPPPESAGDIFVQSNASEVHTDQKPSTEPNSTSIYEPGGDDENRTVKRSSSERAAQLRAYMLEKGQELGEIFHDIIIEPDYEPLQPPRGTEVSDPVTAVLITVVAFWEIAANRTRK